MGIPQKNIQQQAGQFKSKPVSFHLMVKGAGSKCNLECKYCYYLSKENLYRDSHFHMQEETLEHFTQQYIVAQDAPEVTFSWQGGEPTLLGVDFYKKAVEYQHKYKKPGMKIINTLQTNGLLLNKEWAEFLYHFEFLVGVSLDGPEKMHDAYRVDKGGNPTHNKVIKGINILKEYGVDFNILCCVHKSNASHPLDVYRYLRDDIGAQYIQFIPIVERDNLNGYQEGYRVTRRSVGGKKYGNFLINIFDEWVRNDVGKIFVQIFDVALAVWSGKNAGLCIFEKTCGKALALEHNGDLYCCDHYVEPRYIVGNIEDDEILNMVSSDKQYHFGQAKLDALPQYCMDCEVRFICNGGCPKNRIRRTPTGEPGLNYLCEGYKAFFLHIDKPIRLMSKLIRLQRAPSDIMFLSDFF
jgi:uncharacterized protein